MRLLAVLPIIGMLAACAARPVGDSGPARGTAVPRQLPADPVPQAEERSRYGNGPIYEVYGKPYRVMETSYGYQERGVASWYGSKFHGRPTSSQEPYDMHQLTAAHKTLPLPTYVQVTNLKNNKSVVVRVNDRGPFVGNRIIDLSYAAARRIDMVRDGTSLVEITAISFDSPPENTARQTAEQQSDSETNLSAPTDSGRNTVYVQVGAFGERANAERRFQLLSGNGIDNAFVFEDLSVSPALYRVRIGPIKEVSDYDTVVAGLERLGIGDSHIVTD